MQDCLRHERKYLAGEGTAALLRSRVRSLLVPDSHSGGVYRVGNLYLDDVYDSAYTEKRSGIARRKKYRVRHYNDDLGFIRLECKHKEGVMVKKAGSPVTRAQWEAFHRGEMPTLWDSDDPVWCECALLHLTRRLKPVLRLCYRREAFVYEPGNVRVTIDSALCAASVRGEAEYRAFAPGQSVIELKYDRFLPDAVAMLFSGLSLRENAVSKYVLAKEALWKVWRHDKT